MQKKGVILLTGNGPPLDRVFFELGPLTIYWYGVIIATGVFLGLYLATKEADRLGLKKDLVIDLIVFAIPIAIISARMYYVIFVWNQYVYCGWRLVFAVWNGGIVIHGSLIASVITAIFSSRVKKVSFWQLADILAPSRILRQAIGRWGYFIT